MPSIYDFHSIEKKWQAYWQENHTFQVESELKGKENLKRYILDMFPYPSGNGLHVGHPEGYTATDIYSRYLRMKGFQVLHPIGFDSFGLPAENYAIKTGIHPAISTQENIKNFTRQIKSLGLSYDWSREIQTSDPSYYKWTQWIFTKLFNADLAYEADILVNWCNNCKAVLANEEVIDGKCERCGNPVVRKELHQWMLKITAYADKLLENLDSLDWPSSIKALQKNWIGKSNGATISFNVKDCSEKINVYTTRPDTLYGVSYLVLSPENKLVEKITTTSQKNAVQIYQEQAKRKSDLERTSLEKDKSGVFTGAFALHPLTGEEVPIWISDYVLAQYGTGAVMAVPAHDTRDFAFAKKFNLPIKVVISPNGKEIDSLEEAYTDKGILIHSKEMDQIDSEKAKLEIIKLLESKNKGKKSTQFKLRDWVFSRQRFWGEPIPIVHCEKCGAVALELKDLPLTLPELNDFKPDDDGHSPLAKCDSWVNTVCPKCGGKAKRETNTMPQWAGSCWYYLRYLDPHNDKCFIDKKIEKNWMPVDLYVGGAEHAVLHLLYARFWHRFLYDQGFVSTKEPFARLRNQGIILGENGEKMSKSRGNVINPDTVIAEFGADAMRIYEMFMGPLDIMKPWSTSGLKGIKKFLDKVYKLYFDYPLDSSLDKQTDKLMNQTIQKVTHDIETLNNFNTAISQLMVFTNYLTKLKTQNKEVLTVLAKLLSPFAPHLGEELYEHLGYKEGISYSTWPSFDEKKLKEESFEMVIQINGKVKEKMLVENNISKEEMEKLALENEKIKARIVDSTIQKVICVPHRLVNIVIS